MISPLEIGLVCGVAEREAKRILEDYGLSEFEVPLEALAKAEGATVTYRPSAANGSITIRDGRYVINIDPNYDTRRQRFTLAHEIGHMVFDRVCKQIPQNERYRAGAKGHSTALEEQFCNSFASRLLIPSVVARQLCNWASFSFEQIDEIADQLRVSPMALSYRVLDEDGRSGGLLWLKLIPKPSNEHEVRLRVWKAFFPNESTYIPQYKSIPERSILHSAWDSEGESRWFNVDLSFCGVQRNRVVLTTRRQKSMLAIVCPHELSTTAFNKHQLKLPEE